MTHNEQEALLQQGLVKFNHQGHRVHMLMHPDDKPYFKAIMDYINTRTQAPKLGEYILPDTQEKLRAMLKESFERGQRSINGGK